MYEWYTIYCLECRHAWSGNIFPEIPHDAVLYVTVRSKKNQFLNHGFRNRQFIELSTLYETCSGVNEPFEKKKGSPLFWNFIAKRFDN